MPWPEVDIWNMTQASVLLLRCIAGPYVCILYMMFHFNVGYDYDDVQVQNRYIWLPLLCLTPPTEGFPWDDLRKILPGCQQMASVPNGVEMFRSPYVIFGEYDRRKFQSPEQGARTLQTDRQTTDRRTADDIQRAKTQTNILCIISQPVVGFWGFEPIPYRGSIPGPAVGHSSPDPQFAHTWKNPAGDHAAIVYLMIPIIRIICAVNMHVLKIVCSAKHPCLPATYWDCGCFSMLPKSNCDNDVNQLFLVATATYRCQALGRPTALLHSCG